MLLHTLFREYYDVAISVNGKDPNTLNIASDIAKVLTKSGLKVFYYRSEKEAKTLLGANLKNKLKEVYTNRSKLVIAIGSINYGVKGYTVLEWNWIKERKQDFPEENFLLPIAVNEVSVSEDFNKFGYLVFSKVNPVLKEVRRRLGVWGRIKEVLYPFIFFGLSGYLIYLLSSIHFFEKTNYITLGLFFTFGIIWWIFFWILPRLRPELILRQKREYLGLLMNKIFLNENLERFAFFLIISLGIFNITLLPTRQERIDTLRGEWLNGTNESLALDFFSNQVSIYELNDIFIPFIIDNNQNPIDRGKMFDLYHKSLKSQTKNESNTPISATISEYAKQHLFNTIDTNNIHQLYIDIDISQAAVLDDTDLNSISFIGLDYPLERTKIRNSNFSGSYFYAYNIAKSDLRWNDFSNCDFLGIQGSQSDLSGSQFEESIFFGSTLDSVNFSNANLSGTFFSNCSLQNCNFNNAVLQGSVFKNCDLTNTVFADPNIKWVDRWGILAAVTFIDYKVDSVNFRGNKFNSTDITVGKRLSKDLSGKHYPVYSFLPEISSLSDQNITVDPARILNSSLRGSKFKARNINDLIIDKKTYDQLTNSLKPLFEEKTEIDNVELKVSPDSLWFLFKEEKLNVLYKN